MGRKSSYSFIYMVGIGIEKAKILDLFRMNGDEESHKISKKCLLFSFSFFSGMITKFKDLIFITFFFSGKVPFLGVFVLLPFPFIFNLCLVQYYRNVLPKTKTKKERVIVSVVASKSCVFFFFFQNLAQNLFVYKHQFSYIFLFCFLIFSFSVCLAHSIDIILNLNLNKVHRKKKKKQQ